MDVIAFGALIKRKRGEAKLSQEKLAGRIYDDPGRKSDISRLERGLVASPQEKTIQYLCDALNISTAEMEPIRQSRPNAAQLDQIPTLSREELQNLAARFEIEGAFDKGDEELRGYLMDKANEYRALRQQIATMDDTIAEVAKLKDAAETAAKDLRFDEVEDLLAAADFAETALNAQTKITRANNALLRNKTEQAFDILTAAADSFRSTSPTAPAQFKLQFEDILYQHGRRYGSNGMTLSEQMIRDALSELPQDQFPELWGSGTNSLAIALRNQGTRTEGPAGVDLLAQAVTAYRNALEVRTRADQPEQWATTQNNLAVALEIQGTRTEGPTGADLLAQAVTAYRNALEVYTRADHPVQWAGTQNNLGAALRNQGSLTEGPAGADLLAQAVTAYRNALEVYTRADHPVDWAATQNNLAVALANQGIRSEGPAGADLLAQAVTAYRNALEVRTRADHTVQWAMTQENIAIALLSEAGHDSCTDSARALTDALAAVDAALTVYDPEHMSYDHGTAIRLRNDILAQLDALS